MKTRPICLAVASLAATIPLGAAAPVRTTQQYYPGPGIYCYSYDACYPIVYSREVYSDAELTNLIGSGVDTCYEYGQYVYVSTPWLPAGYEVATPSYVCQPGGPYVPPPDL